METLKILIKTEDNNILLKDVVSLNWDDQGNMNMIKVNLTDNIHALLLMEDKDNSGVFFNTSKTMQGRLINKGSKILGAVENRINLLKLQQDLPNQNKKAYNQIKYSIIELESLYSELKQINYV
jgi:hypothetical protein